MKIAWLFVWLTLPLLIVVPVYPHGGGLDAQGCHHDRKDGGYHCHRAQSTETEATSQTKPRVIEGKTSLSQLRSLTLDHAVVVITTARAVEKSMSVLSNIS